MTLPKFSRQPIRPDKEPGADREIWFPSWKCFCCHDYGTVQLPLILLIIPDYNHHRDKAVRCQNPRCEAGQQFANDENYDQRFTIGICTELDKIGRKDWANYLDDARQRARAKAAIVQLTGNKAMPGSKPRTENDNREIQQRKADIEAITHEQWIAQGQQYFQGHLEEYGNEMS